MVLSAIPLKVLLLKWKVSWIPFRALQHSSFNPSSTGTYHLFARAVAEFFKGYF